MTVPTCRRAICHSGEAQKGGSKMFPVFRYSCIGTSLSRLPLTGISDHLPRLRYCANAGLPNACAPPGSKHSCNGLGSRGNSVHCCEESR
jgi:hypothetical protein